MDGFLRVNATTSAMPASPTNLFLAEEVASTCPLITPSPPTNDLINPPPDENQRTTFIIGEELANKLKHVKDDDKAAGDSGSSSSSVLAEPVCTQLLNHRHHYSHITKDENTTSQETNGKVQPMQLTFRNPPDDYFFMKWNWVLIRKVSIWTFLSGLIAMTALVVMMVGSLPKRCNPPTEWYQGGLMYEIFPASFHDADNDGVGDLKGIAIYADYIKQLGVSGVRLNSIFPATHYPEHYKNISTLLEIDPKLGSLRDFNNMVNALHLRNISILLDFPLYPHIQKLPSHQIREFNESQVEAGEFARKRSLENPNSDEISEALQFWMEYGVDGFYFKGLENYLEDPLFVPNLRRWKKLVRENPIIIDNAVLNKAPMELMNTILTNVDLVDIQVKIENGVSGIRNQLDSIQNGTLFSKASMPWIHWSLGNVDSIRLADRLHYGNATLGAILLQLMLPGTPCIFYGDEVGMHQVEDPENDREDLKHLHQLGAMIWEELRFTKKGLLPWMHGKPTHSNFKQLELVSKMAKLRVQSPSIYVNTVLKDGQSKANSEVKYSQGDLLVIQRYYPRRKSFVVVSNLGANLQTADLSKLLYTGNVIVGPKVDSKSESISFKEISLWPGESVVIELD
ncbi:PREDICTED: neutral and basic amino acid transport protein rBAT-like [Nicrophorus vespilloides]|uniref:Neutral and basic amino acid transport protein rBAT-like n=1 Tax=Nicrophorus vespilloides TaxID=110193 RepID=A0ABM1NCP0_NICVS|nr:PREDICTED: neutral and basic amino acid transport protein rBAT-like [Nicrophorus vespilloides]